MKPTAQRIRAIVEIIRPQQIIKNFFVFAPLIFSHTFWDVSKIYASGVAFVLFSVTTWGVYIFNDLCDLKHDRQNPLRATRPLVRGDVSVPAAWGAAIVCMLISLVCAYWYNQSLFAILVLYVLLNVTYTLWTKYQPILELFSVAFGFILRVLAGIVVIEVAATSWMLGATFFLALFLIASKRLREYMFTQDPGVRRSVLSVYSKGFLHSVVFSSLIFTVTIYFFYAFLQIHNPYFLITVVPVLYGMLRFLWLVEESSLITDSPTELIYHDTKLLLSVACFGILVAGFFLFLPDGIPRFI